MAKVKFKQDVNFWLKENDVDTAKPRTLIKKDTITEYKDNEVLKRLGRYIDILDAIENEVDVKNEEKTTRETVVETKKTVKRG